MLCVLIFIYEYDYFVCGGLIQMNVGDFSSKDFGHPGIVGEVCNEIGLAMRLMRFWV